MATFETSLFSAIAAFVLTALSILPILRWKAIVDLLLPRSKYDGQTKAGLELNESPLPLSNSTNTELSTCPPSWGSDEKLFLAERRAIFSRSWHFITHSSHFRKIGDYRTYSVAGFSILLILGKDGQLRAFHNVCRHRAYVLTKKECGSSRVLGCRYHGWSYDSRGSLIKAPEFDKVEGFDKSQNSLWKVRLEIRKGLVFVNFDTSSVPVFDAVDETTLESWAIENLAMIDEWKVEGAFNWKLTVDDFLNDRSPAETPRHSVFSAFFRRSPGVLVVRYSARLIHLSDRDLLTVRVLPQSSTVTLIECCVFGRKTEPSFQQAEEIQTWKTYMIQLVKNCVTKQKGLLARTPSSLSPEQNNIRKAVETHLDRERLINREINPASRVQGLTQIGEDDDKFCRDLENDWNRESICSASAKGLLDW